MHTVTILSAPAARGLEPALAEALRGAWGGSALRWLAPREAVEFDMPALPGNVAEVQADLDRLGLDLAVQPAQGRRKRLLIADMDSTMIRQECVDELAAEAGVGSEVAAITTLAMNGALDFGAALRARVALLAGLDTAVIGHVLSSRIEPMPGGRVLVATMRAAGAYALLVSGGFTVFTGPIAARLGFDAHQANTLLVANGRLTGRVAEPILGREAKVAALRETCARLGIDPSEALAVGDGANDLGMLALAGTGVALHAKPVVQQQARIRINHGDLTALLYLQGYAAGDLVAA